MFADCKPYEGESFGVMVTEQAEIKRPGYIWDSIPSQQPPHIVPDMAVSVSNTNRIRLIHTLNDTRASAEPAEHRHAILSPKIWVGFIKQGRSFLDTASQRPNIEQQIKGLQEYHEQKLRSLSDSCGSGFSASSLLCL